MSCVCHVCQRPVDCGETVCPICENELELKSCSIEPSKCSDGVHCTKVIREVKPGLFVVQLENGTYSLKWLPENAKAVLLGSL